MWRAVHWRKAPPIRTALRTLYHRQGGRCAYCQRPTVLPPRTEDRVTGVLYASKDHRHPRSRGGSDYRGNLVMACERCNQIKMDMPWESWVKFMSDNPRWWEMEPTVKWVEKTVQSALLDMLRWSPPISEPET